MPSFIRLDMTMEKGTTRRGKYTFPNICWLALNVSEHLVRQSASVPTYESGKIEHRLGHSVGGYASYAAEHKHEHNRCQHGLYEKPHRAEYGLLVERNDVSLDVHPQEIAIAPHLLEVEAEQSPFIVDDYVPLVLHISYFLIYDAKIRYFLLSTKFFMDYFCIISQH